MPALEFPDSIRRIGYQIELGLPKTYFAHTTLAVLRRRHCLQYFFTKVKSLNITNTKNKNI